MPVAGNGIFKKAATDSGDHSAAGLADKDLHRRWRPTGRMLGVMAFGLVLATALVPAPPAMAAAPPDAAPDAFTAIRSWSNAVDLAWIDTSTNETSFEIDVQKGPRDYWHRLQTLSMPAVPASETGRKWYAQHGSLPTDTFSCYRVSAVNSAGKRTSPVRCAVPARPSAPASLQLNVLSNYRAHFAVTRSHTWEWGYRIYARRAGNAPWILRTEAFPYTFSELVYTYSAPLTPQRYYCFRATAFNPHGESGPTPEVCATTPIAPPPAPTDLSMTNTKPTSVTLRWTDIATTETRYALIRNWVHDNGTESGIVVRRWGPLDGVTTYTDSGLQPNTRYTYWLYVANAGGSVRAEISARTASSPPAPPSAQKAELAFSGGLWHSPTYPRPYQQFTLNWWTCNSGGTASGTFTSVAQLDGDTTYSTTVPSLLPGACYLSTVNVPGMFPGDHYWYVYLDTGGQVAEQYENNNINSYIFKID